MNPDLEFILSAGNQAPSGENCQPWKFVVSGNKIDLHLLPERDQSAYNWGQRGSYMSCGAVIENIVIAASSRGYATDIVCLPTSSNAEHVASINLRKDPSIKADSLAEFISRRVTNRKSYKIEPLTSNERETLSHVESIEAQVVLVEDRSAIEDLARVGSTNEEVMIGNKALHQFFFSHINWTKEEDEQKKIGFYIKTLELPPPAVFSFKIIKSWSVMKVFRSLGFPKVVAKQNAATYAASAAIGAILLAGDTPLDYIKGGRALERIWLTVTSLGLSLQPLTGILFFDLRISHGDTDLFSADEQKKIISAYETAQGVLSTGSRRVGFMFRVGRGEAPSAQAVRFPIKDVVTVRV